jgi:thioredoxin-like negative regulator of GroEL
MPKVRLDSWKSIADYLERSPRTVQRWHAYHALPVHHFGGLKGSVFAYGEEIDRWLMSLAQENRLSDVGSDDTLAARNSQSCELVLRAHEMWESRSEENLQTIAGLYRKAIDQNPANTEALTGLANSLISAALHGVMDGAIAYPAATEALRRTSQLNADDVAAQCAAAWLRLVNERKGRQARAGFEEVLSRQPDCSFALGGMALSHVAAGDLDGAKVWAWKAWQQNTLVPILGSLVCWIEYLAGANEAAIDMAEQMRMGGGCGGILAIIDSLALIEAGPSVARLKRIAALASESPHSLTLQCVLAHASALSGKRARAREIFATIEPLNAQKKRSNAYGMALMAMALGNDMEAIRWLETSFAEGSLWSLALRSDPILNPLRDDPRFQTLIRRCGVESVASPYAGHLELITRAG